MAFLFWYEYITTSIKDVAEVMITTTVKYTQAGAGCDD
jgi:hypothetical protein